MAALLPCVFGEASVLGRGAWSREEQLPGLVDYEAVPHSARHDAHPARIERQHLRLIAEVKDDLNRAGQAHQHLIAAWVHLPVAVLFQVDDPGEASVELTLAERLPELGRGGVEHGGLTLRCEVQEGLLGIQ